MISTFTNHKILVLIPIIFAQLYTPKVYMGFNTFMVPDFFLIYLTYLSIYNTRLFLILIGFLLGFIQDIISQYHLLGLFAFTKTITAFILGTLYKYDKIWKKNIKLLFLFLTYLFHFILSSYFMFERSITPIAYILEISLLQSIWMFLILYVVNKFILIDNKIID